jgi:hypothetical protein
MNDGRTLFNIRLSKAEKERMREKARKDGYYELSAWIRHIINADDEQTRRQQVSVQQH